MRRTQRLFALTEYLRGRRTGVTAEVLAERFGVTVRTIYRDLDALREADLPLGAERGRGGGYALDRAYTLPPVNFDARQAALLIAVGQQAVDMRLMPFVDTLQAALDKVRAALSTSAQRELLTRLEGLQFLGVPGLPSVPAVRAAVERAWFEQRCLRITYVDGDHLETTRDLRLHGVLMQRHETRLDADDLSDGERRHFRLDRIVRAEVLDDEPGARARRPRPRAAGPSPELRRPSASGSRAARRSARATPSRKGCRAPPGSSARSRRWTSGRSRT